MATSDPPRVVCSTGISTNIPLLLLRRGTLILSSQHFVRKRDKLGIHIQRGVPFVSRNLFLPSDTTASIS